MGKSGGLHTVGSTPVPLTPVGLGVYLSRPAAAAARAASTEVRGVVGRLAWAAAWPAWRVVTMPAVLAILIRVGIELAIGLFARPHATLIRLVIQFLLGMLASPTASVGAIPNSGGLLDEIERYRQDPRTRETLVALERLLTGADVPSVPARVGLAVAYTEDASVDVAIDPNDEGFVVGGLRFKFVSKNQSKSKGGDS